jgi:hypothetical protein
MDVFCPHCLQNVTLEGREPGEYSFACPECADEVRVTIPQNPAERPVVRPVRKPSSNSSPQLAKSRAPGQAKASRSSWEESGGQSRSDRQSRPPARGIDREPVDFPFEPSDDNLVDAHEDPPQDEWDGPQFEIPQPLRGTAKKKKTESKPRSRNSQTDLEFSAYLKWMAVGAALWLVMTVTSVFVPEFGWATIVAGVLILLTSRRMILRIARKEGTAIWLACLLVPFYSLFFVFAHFRQTARALVIAFFGYAFLISGVGVLAVHDLIDDVNAIPAAADPDDDDGDEELQKAAAGKMLAGIDSLTLTVDGKETRVRVNQLTCFEANLGKGAAAESFEFSGPDVSLRGSFPPGFHGDWTTLPNKPIKISPRSDQPGPGESHLKLPGRGSVKVTGGEFVVSGAMTVGQPQVFGAIEIDIGGPQKPETIRGTFLVRVKTGN